MLPVHNLTPGFSWGLPDLSRAPQEPKVRSGKPQLGSGRAQEGSGIGQGNSGRGQLRSGRAKAEIWKSSGRHLEEPGWGLEGYAIYLQQNIFVNIVTYAGYSVYAYQNTLQHIDKS